MILQIDCLYGILLNVSKVGGNMDFLKKYGIEIILRNNFYDWKVSIKSVKPLIDGIASIEVLTVDGHVKRGKYVSSHVHLNCSFLLEADETEELHIKEDENSGVKWIDINEALKLTNEAKMVPIYKKLNNRVFSLK